MITEDYTIVQERVSVYYSKQKFFSQLRTILRRIRKLGLAAAYAIRK